MADKDTDTTPDAEATVVVTEVVAVLPDRPPRLFVQISIDCPNCGKQELVIAGEHVKTLHTAFAGLIAHHPDLTGSGAERQDTTQFRIPGDTPDTSRFN